MTIGADQILFSEEQTDEGYRPEYAQPDKEPNPPSSGNLGLLNRMNIYLAVWTPHTQVPRFTNTPTLQNKESSMDY